MTLARYTAWTLFAGVGFALFAGAARAQDPPLPKQDSKATGAVSGYKNIERGGIPKDQLPEVRENFAKVAKYYAEVIAHPSVYRGPQEFKPDVFGNPYTIDGPSGILVDMNRFLLEPAPGKRIDANQAVYIHELGAALDAALKDKILNHSEVIVRVNAARVLAHVCKGGAPAHYATLTSLLSNANTRTEIKYYLFHAAANLLSAYDPNYMKLRNHALQTDDPKPLGAPVKALEDCITNPALLVAGLPDNKVDKATADQLAVVALVRRQAIKALAQVRYVSVLADDGKTPMYPAYTLARVAVGDPALVPAPGPADAAEAALGLLNMAPVEVRGDKITPMKYNSDAAVEVITAALVTFAKPRAADAFDRSLPWRSYAVRFADGLRTWRALHDPDLDPSAPTKFDATRVPAVVNDLYTFAAPNVLFPMEKVTGDGKPDVSVRVNIEELQTRLAAIRNNPKRNTTLFPGNAQTTIVFDAPKK